MEALGLEIAIILLTVIFPVVVLGYPLAAAQLPLTKVNRGRSWFLFFLAFAFGMFGFYKIVNTGHFIGAGFEIRDLRSPKAGDPPSNLIEYILSFGITLGPSFICFLFWIFNRPGKAKIIQSSTYKIVVVAASYLPLILHWSGTFTPYL